VLAPHLAVVTARDRDEALAHAANGEFEMVLLDWNLSKPQGGAEVLAALREAGCGARVVVVSGETDPVRISEMLALGIAGFIPKAYSGERMLDALDIALRGCIFLPPELVNEIADIEQSHDGGVPDDVGPRLKLLTPRQVDVFRAAARGLPNKLIARELGIAEATVKTHLSAVFAALGVTNRTQAALVASRESLQVG
jgi:DNA-binding NarL/FixJ family response regulator